MVSDNMSNVFNHSCFVGRPVNDIFIFGVEGVDLLSPLKVWEGMRGVIMGIIFIDPNFSLSIFVKADHMIVYDHWAAFVVGGFIPFKGAVKDVE